MMLPIENAEFDQWVDDYLGQPSTAGIGVFAKIRMMNETFATDFQFFSELAKISLDNLSFCMDERIECENEIDRIIGNHGQRSPVIHMALHARISGKPLPTYLNAVRDAVHGQ